MEMSEADVALLAGAVTDRATKDLIRTLVTNEDDLAFVVNDDEQTDTRTDAASEALARDLAAAANTEASEEAA